jgi:hypothetical protein
MAKLQEVVPEQPTADVMVKAPGFDNPTDANRL